MSMVDDVVVNNAATIERCLDRVRDEFGDDGRELETDQRRQDALVLNLLRACETAIDLAMHAVRVRGLGAPQSSRDAFVKLVDDGLLERTLGDDLQRMVGFRNVAVHGYQDLDLDVLRSIVRQQLRGVRRVRRGVAARIDASAHRRPSRRSDTLA